MSDYGRRQAASQYAGTTINTGRREDYDCAPIGAEEEHARTWDTGCDFLTAETEAELHAAATAATAAVLAVYEAILASRAEIAGEPVGYGARTGDCISIPAGPLAGTWEVDSMWERGPMAGARPTQHPVLASLLRPRERCLVTHEELAAWGATYCARPPESPCAP